MATVQMSHQSLGIHDSFAGLIAHLSLLLPVHRPLPLVGFQQVLVTLM
jgi:hypothetical protein